MKSIPAHTKVEFPFFNTKKVVAKGTAVVLMPSEATNAEKGYVQYSIISGPLTGMSSRMWGDPKTIIPAFFTVDAESRQYTAVDGFSNAVGFSLTKPNVGFHNASGPSTPDANTTTITPIKDTPATPIAPPPAAPKTEVAPAADSSSNVAMTIGGGLGSVIGIGFGVARYRKAEKAKAESGSVLGILGWWALFGIAGSIVGNVVASFAKLTMSDIKKANSGVDGFSNATGFAKKTPGAASVDQQGCTGRGGTWHSSNYGGYCKGGLNT